MFLLLKSTSNLDPNFFSKFKRTLNFGSRKLFDMNLDGFIAHKNNTKLDQTHMHDNIQYRRFPHTTLHPTWCGKFDKEDVLPLNKLPRSHNKMLTPNDSQLIVTEQTDYPLKQRHLQSGLEWNGLQLPQIPSGTASWNPDIQNLLLVTNAWLHE